MSRSMKFGIATIVAAMVVSMVAPEDAEARHRRHHRRRGGCFGYSACCGVPQTCCGVAAAPVYQSGCATGACGVATSACPTGTCTIAGGGYSGGYSAGYGQSVQGINQHQQHPTMPPAPQGSFDSAPPAPGVNGGATLRDESRTLNGSRNGARLQDRGTSSPSDRSNDRPSLPADESDRSAPPPPPQEQ